MSDVDREEPVRLRLSRRPGFELQSYSRGVNGRSAVNVARPSKFGNPFTLQEAVDAHDCGPSSAHRHAVAWFRAWLTQPDDHHDQGDLGSYGHLRERRRRLMAALPELRGCNVACHCAEGFACHGDVLLELAREGTAATVRETADA